MNVQHKVILIYVKFSLSNDLMSYLCYTVHFVCDSPNACDATHNKRFIILCRYWVLFGRVITVFFSQWPNYRKDVIINSGRDELLALDLREVCFDYSGQ